MPIGTTAAIIGAGVLGAGASVFGASKNAKAISQSTDTSLQANRESIAAQERATQQQLAYLTNAYNSSGKLQTDIYNQNQTTLQPWAAGGGAAFNQINGMLGLPQQTFTAPQQLAFTPISSAPPTTPATTPQQPAAILPPNMQPYGAA